MAKVLGFVPTAETAEQVIAWSVALAGTDGEVEIVCFNDEAMGETAATVRSELKKYDSESVRLSLTQNVLVVSAVTERCRSFRPNRLVSAHFEMSDVGRLQTSAELIRRSPCQTFLVEFGAAKPADVKRILFVATHGAHDLDGVKLVNQIAESINARVTIATIEDETSDKAKRAGKRAIQSLLHDAAIERNGVEIRVEVDQSMRSGIEKCVDCHDLVVIGRDGAKSVRPLRIQAKSTTVVVVNRAPPLQRKALADWLPQIHPSDHADLLQSLRQGSRWGSDFTIMLSLASGIASYGLIQNSPAVVIGSMLLAPLMTPMIASGLSLAQANAKLGIRSVETIGLGILLALAVSFLVGILTPSRETLSPEILARGGPNVLDLFIALLASIAATYAMARPNLSGAIAGVAIATALVPPLCAVGLSLAAGKFTIALGASMLFATNLVAIIIAASFTFTMMGVSASRSLPLHRRISGVVRFGLAALLVLLAGPLSAMLFHQLAEGRNQTLGFPVTRAVAQAVNGYVDKTNETTENDVKLTFLARSGVETQPAVIIHIASQHELDIGYADGLRNVVRREMDDPELQVIVVALRGWWRSDMDRPSAK